MRVSAKADYAVRAAAELAAASDEPVKGERLAEAQDIPLQFLEHILLAVEGPIAHVQSSPPESIEYRGHAEHLQEVWIAVRANLRAVLEHVTLADLVSGELPSLVEDLAAEPDAWAPR